MENMYTLHTYIHYINFNSCKFKCLSMDPKNIFFSGDRVILNSLSEV